MKFSHYVEKLKQQFTSVCALMDAFLCSITIFCVGAYKRDVVVVIKIGPYIHVCVVPIIVIFTVLNIQCS